MQLQIQAQREMEKRQKEKEKEMGLAKKSDGSLTGIPREHPTCATSFKNDPKWHFVQNPHTVTKPGS